MAPIGGADNIGWNEAEPPVTESAGLGSARIISTKSSIRQVVAAEHNMSSGGGNAQGYHLFGSARPYYGLQSAVSSTGSDGRLMLTSDTSKLFAVGSGGTSLLGGPTVLSLGTYPGGTAPQRHEWVEEIGAGITDSSGSTTVSIPNSGYSGMPYVFVTGAGATVGAAASGVILSVLTLTASTFAVTAFDPAGLAYQPSTRFFWRSLGTRVL